VNTQTNSLSLSSILATIFNSLASLVDFIFCIPYLGRILKWLWNSLLTLIQLIFGLLEEALNYHPIKVLRFGVIILNDEEGNPLTTPEKIYPEILRTQEILDQAKVKIIPAFPAPKKGRESGRLPDAEYWIRTQSTPASKTILDVDCNTKAMLQDLAMTGVQYQFKTIQTLFSTSFRRVFGIGAPITVFVVRDIGTKAGCSLGWLSDYVTLKSKLPLCLAHEIGHACNLFHTDDKENLMYEKSCRPVKLTKRQIGLLRASRHVSYF